MSKIRTPTISPSKQATKDVTKIYYQSPLDKQFIMFSLVQKQSSMGITSNERLLLFNSQDKSLRYYSSVPIPLPDPSKPLPDAKQIIYIKKVRNFQFKATKTGIGKVSVKWSDLNGEGGSKKIWSLKFQNNTIMTKWIMDVAQAIKDGHYKTDNRPKTERRQTKPNIDKYMTPFIAQTGGIQSRRNSSSKSNFINSSSDSNQKWLSELVKKKQEQINYNHTNLSMVSKSDSEEKKQKLQNIKSEQKKYQTAEKVSDNDRDFLKSIKFNSNTPISKLPQKIPVIIEQDESKFSKRSQLQLNNSQSTKNFRINRPLPDQINQLSQDVESSHIRNLQDSILENKVKSDQQYLSNFINQLRKQPQYDLAEASSYQPIKPTFFSQFQKYEFKEPQQEWLNPSKFYPYLYSQFIKISQQISKKIIQNLPTFLDEARRVPSEALYATQSQIFVTIKSIQFSIPIAPVLNSFEAQLKMHQYSSIVGYIKRKSQNDKFPHNKYTTVLPIPFCMVEYQWYQIKCKAIIPKSYPKIPQEQAITIDKYFGIPNLLWIYHGFDSVLVVDFAVKGLTINSQIQQNVLEQAATKLLQQQISICHIKDLSEYCYSHFKFKLNPKVIKLILNKILQINSKIGPIINVLISLLYAIKCSEYIKDQLLSKLYIISEGQIYEMITGFIKILATQRNTTFANKILLALTQQLKLSHFDIQFQIQDYVVYSSLIFLLALHVENVGRNKEDTFKFHPIPYTYNAQCLSKQMEQLEQILKMSQVQNWSEERRGKGFQKITEILKKFQYLWMEAQDNQFHFQQYKSVGNYKSRRNSNFQRINSKSANSVSRNQKLKYFNNYYQLMHYQSLYKPYAPTLMSLDSFNSSDTYNLELEQLVSENPPTYFSYLIGINCIKWVSKKGNTNHEVVEKMVYDQITNSRKWCGNFSPVSLMYYQLWAIYNEQIFNIQTAIQYARYALQVVIQLYGDDSAEAAQRWFLLGNIMMEGSLYEQALQAYLKSLRVLKSFQIINQSSLSASRDTLLKWNEKTDDAQLTIRSKMIKIYLSMGKLEQCIDQCSLGLLTCQNLTNHNSNTELQILSTIIRCCQLRKQSSKALTMIQTVSIQFGNRIHQLCSNEGPSSGFTLQMLQEQEQLRQNMIKICLSPAIAFRITDRIRKLYLLKITKAIRGKYEGRHNKRQYNRYLTKNAYISLQNNDSEQPPNIINWFLFYLQNIPMYSTNMKFRQRNSSPLQGIDINYSLYQNALGSKILPVTQPKILIPALRAIQVFCGIVGFSYIEGCLLD